MAQRLRFILDGDDQLSRVLNHAGDSSARLHRRLNDDARNSGRALRVFTRDANGQLRDLEGRFVSVAHASRLIQDSNGRWRDLNGRFIASTAAAQRMAAVTAGLPVTLRQVGQNAQGAGTRLGQLAGDADTAGRTVNNATTGMGNRLRDVRGRFISAGGAAGSMGEAAAGAGSKLGGLGSAGSVVAGIVGLSLLPALGALVPMLAGGALAAGTLKLGFSGIADAMAAAGEGKEEYAKALKKLPPPARDFTRALVGLKKEFGGLGKDIQKAMLPGFTQAVKSASPLVKLLGKNMTDLGGVFGKAGAAAGRMFKDSGFQKDLQANLTLGKQFVGDMLSGVGRLGRGFLDFGAASKPTLTALSSGIRDLLGRALPGMFDGLKTGIQGSSQFLTGFFNMVNNLLPALGRFSGQVARTFGPLLGEVLSAFGTQGAAAMDVLGKGVQALSPVFKDAAFGVKSIMEVLKIVAPTVKDVGNAIVGSFLPSFAQVDQARGPMQRLFGVIQNNRGAIQEFARLGAQAFLTLVDAGIQNLPLLIKVFRLTTGAMVFALGGVLHAAASAFGWIPGLGGKLKSADKAFQRFKESYLGGLRDAESGARDFAAKTSSKLAAGKLKLNINNWEEQIRTAKGQLKSVPPEKRAALKAKIEDLQRKVRDAKASLASIRDKTSSLRARDGASLVVRGVIGLLAQVRSKTATVTTIFRRVEENASPRFRRHGGPVPKFASGGMPSGMLRGPGTGTSDSIPMWWGSNGEFIINAASTKKHRGLIEAINADRLGGSGSTMGGAGTAVAQGLAQGLGAGTGLVTNSSRALAAAILTGLKDELEIASPSKRTRALAKDVGRGLIKGMTGSRAQIKATSKDLAKDIWSAFSGRKDNRLVAYVNRRTKTLLSLAKRRDSIAATIKRANEFAENTRVGAKRAASLGSMFGGEEKVTARGIQQRLAARLRKLRTFTSYIKTLAKRGLNKTMLREILEMGPEEGYAYASALAGSNSGILKAINRTQHKINDGAKSLGRIGADRLYDSGKAAGKGYLEGLKSQQKAIERQMLKIAKAMDKAIRRALGIRSPSTVMARLGRYSTEGLALGLTGGMPALDRALGAVSGRVAATRPALRPAVTGGGATQVVNVQVDVTGAIDPVATARQIQRVLVGLKRVNGVNVNLGVA
ncbi:hypothetical protein [Streptomyces sp. MNP-20]|uniref:hypothetical protein n=1 Tax=Streptomyces sp. MNP-20 TaxID=2721165 RepID=UPI001554E57C|nr:hypothetical protein [Streptomyces sp. MNP-20]